MQFYAFATYRAKESEQVQTDGKLSIKSHIGLHEFEQCGLEEWLNLRYFMCLILLK